MVTKIEEIIKKHTDSILSGQFSPPEGPCIKCFENPDTYTSGMQKTKFSFHL